MTAVRRNEAADELVALRTGMAFSGIWSLRDQPLAVVSLVVRPGVAAVLVAVAAVAGCTAAEPPAAETTAEETTAEASALTVPGSVEAEPAAYLDCDFSDHVDSALEAVWQVKAGLSNGTAFHIGGGQWLTAEHVISGRSTVTLHNSGASITATVEAANRAGDTALLLTSSAPSLLGFGSLSETGPGHQAYAVGSRFMTRLKPQSLGASCPASSAMPDWRT